jgi:hypothetical protein
MGKFAVVLLFLAMATLLWLYVRRSRTVDRRRFIQDYAFPKGLDARLLKRRPELSPAQVALVFDGLRQYFEISLDARKRLASMPSQVVDDLWHEFILYTRNYQAFCNRAFGRYLHHTPAEAMSTLGAQSAGLRRTWWLACKLEGIDPKQPKRLPLLFAIDSQLNISDGFHYVPDCSQARTQSGDAYLHCGSDLGSGSGDSGEGGGGDSSGDGGSSCGGGGCGGD